MRFPGLHRSKRTPLHRQQSQRPPAHPEEGSQVLSNALVQALVVLLFLGMLQLAVGLHVRNSAIYAAGEGARRGALLGGDEGEAIARTTELLNAFNSGHDHDVTARRANHEGGDLLVVSVRTTLPIIGVIGPSWLEVESRAIIEGNTDE